MEIIKLFNYFYWNVSIKFIIIDQLNKSYNNNFFATVTPSSNSGARIIYESNDKELKSVANQLKECPTFTQEFIKNMIDKFSFESKGKNVKDYFDNLDKIIKESRENVIKFLNFFFKYRKTLSLSNDITQNLRVLLNLIKA